MQTHRAESGLPIGTIFLKIGNVVFEQNKIFERSENFFLSVSKKNK